MAGSVHENEGKCVIFLGKGNEKSNRAKCNKNRAKMKKNIQKRTLFGKSTHLELIISPKKGLK